MANKAKTLKMEHNCLKCKIIPCTNFYQKGDETFEGREIYLLHKLAEKRIILPCNVGDIIYATCKLLSFQSVDALHSQKMFAQCIRDLRASAFLLLSCHYRSSIQLLRPVIENCLAGIYWDSKYVLALKQQKKEKFEEEFSLFEKGKFKISQLEWEEVYPKESKQICPRDKQVCPKKHRQKKWLDYEYCLMWITMHRDKIPISFEESEALSEKFHKLNRYLHSNFPQYENISSCCFVKYDKKAYADCMELYQDVGTLMLEILYNYLQVYFPEKEKSAIELIQEIMGDIASQKSLEKEIGAKLIFSKQLDIFLNKPEFSLTSQTK